jgi:hypothetical protein
MEMEYNFTLVETETGLNILRMPTLRFVVKLNAPLPAMVFNGDILESFESMSQASEFARQLNREFERSGEYAVKAIAVDDAN